jgi:phosphoglycolate phosphatase
MRDAKPFSLLMSGLPVPSSTRFRAVLFDLDGTLLHTVPELAHAANRMLQELGLPMLPEALIGSFVGRGIRRTVSSSLAGQRDGEVGEELLSRGLAIFERVYAEQPGSRTLVFPGVMEGLERLAAANLPMGVVTNKAGRFTLQLLDIMGMSRYFGVVVCGDTLAVQKPAPEPLWHACAQLKVAPGDVLFIGDSKHDVAAARAAGCAVWCVPYGYNEGEPADTLACDRMVASLAEAASLICA